MILLVVVVVMTLLVVMIMMKYYLYYSTDFLLQDGNSCVHLVGSHGNDDIVGSHGNNETFLYYSTDFLLQDGNSCVRQCAENYHAMDQKHCKPCNGPCPKSMCLSFPS